MTIGAILAIIFGGLILVGGIIFGIVVITTEYDTGGGIAIIITSIILGLGLIVGAIIYSNTETGKRALKDQKSEFNGGIERVLTVYDINGNIIEQYEGKFDVNATQDDANSYIKFDDENGKRHLIYYTTGTVIIDEK